jgi:hypothetical protein
MKLKRFKKETLINIYEKEGGEFKIKDSVLVEGLLDFDEKEIFSILNRVCFTPSEYTIKREDTVIACFDLSDPTSKRYIFHSKDTIRRQYGLYPKEK